MTAPTPDNIELRDELARIAEGRCPQCGYTRADAALHMDHRLCKGGKVPTVAEQNEARIALTLAAMKAKEGKK